MIGRFVYVYVVMNLRCMVVSFGSLAIHLCVLVAFPPPHDGGRVGSGGSGENE